MKKIVLTFVWCAVAWIMGASIIGVLFSKMGVSDQLTLGIIGGMAGAASGLIALIQGVRGKLPGTNIER